MYGEISYQLPAKIIEEKIIKVINGRNKSYLYIALLPAVLVMAFRFKQSQNNIFDFLCIAHLQ